MSSIVFIILSISLSALKDNTEISQSNYETLNGIKVGYYETSKVRLQNFIEFYETNNIHDIELVPYPYEDGVLLIDKLKSKEVDAIIGGGLLVNNKEKVLAKFGAIPNYLATTKGNEEIISELNSAIYKIKERNPGFSQELYNKYFLSNNDYSLSLTNEEKEYIKNSPKLKAVYIANYNPLQYYDSKTKKATGVFVDFVNLISERSGLEFEFVKAEIYEEVYEMIKNKKADLMVGVPGVFSITDRNDIILTASYIDLDMVKVVGKGEVDVAYGNQYTISHYIAGAYYPNLSIISEGKSVPASVGLSKSSDKKLLTIINKSIYSISDDEVQDIIYKNTMNIEYDITLNEFFLQNLGSCLLIIIEALGTISIMIFIIVKLRFDKIKSSREILFRKTQMDSLTNIS